MRMVTFPLHKQKTPAFPRLLIWGNNDFAARFGALLSVWGCDVAGYVAPGVITEKSFNGRPLIPVEDVRNSPVLSALPLLVASPRAMNGNIPSADQNAQQLFKAALLKILFEHRLTNHLIHPVALITHIDADWSHRCVFFGKQGAGNTVYSHLINALQQAFPKAFKPSNEAACIFEKVSEAYSYQMLEIIYAAAAEIGVTGCGMGPHIPFSCMAAFSHPHDDATHDTAIAGLPAQPWAHASCYGYHIPPTEGQMDILRHMNCKRFLILRSPLDTLISAIKKTADSLHVPLQEYLNNMSAFRHESKTLLLELQQYAHLMHHMEVWRYEELINHPLHVIKKLAKQWDIDLSFITARNIWRRTKFRQLEGAPEGHFWNARSGKWKTLLQPEHYKILGEYGGRNIAETLGYAEEAALIPPAGNSGAPSEAETPQQRSYYYREAGNIVIQSTSPQKADALKTYFNRPFVQAMCNSGSLCIERPETAMRMCNPDKNHLPMATVLS